MRFSLNRVQVEEALNQRGTSLAAFVEAGQQQGKSFEEIWLDLRNTTGVPFSVRTLYRWIAGLEVSA